MLRARTGLRDQAQRMWTSVMIVALLQGVKVFPWRLRPSNHPLYHRHTTKPPAPEMFCHFKDKFCPGFAALRGIPMTPVDAWIPVIERYTNSSANGGFDIANCIWPGYSIIFSENFPAIARYLRSKHIPAVDLGGFVPGGRQCFDVHRGVPSQSFLTEGLSILNPVDNPDDGLLLGLDMGEQDVRYLWGYARRGVLQPEEDRLAQYIQFRDYSWAIAWQSGTLMASLQSSTYGGHYWHKTGMYTTAGAETSQANGNAQLLYAFIRGSAKQYGLLWYGQVSIFNWFGYKIPGDPKPSQSCNSQQDHSATCGTSLSLMKRLMYTQLAYDSVYFAFEGGWEYPGASQHTGLSPIGQLQRQAKNLFS